MGPVTSYSTAAVDNVLLFIVAVSMVFLVGLTIAMIFFVVRYGRRRHPKPEAVRQSTALEVTWTLIPTVLVLAMFFYGYSGFTLIRSPPEDAMVIKVLGRMWDWSFEYENGKKADVLRVPVGEPVRLALESGDVLHSFFVPSFRIKEDVVPGRETFLWFKPEGLGTADVFCAEYCGTEHAFMMSTIEVMEESAFEEWYATLDRPEDHPAYQVMDDVGCFFCHTVDGTIESGPTFQGLFGKTQRVIRDGEEAEVIVDRDYIRRSILDPLADVSVDWDPDMPEDAGEDLTAEQLEAVIDFLEKLK